MYHEYWLYRLVGVGLSIGFVGGILMPFRYTPWTSYWANAWAVGALLAAMCGYFLCSKKSLPKPNGVTWTWLLLLVVVCLQPSLNGIVYVDYLLQPIAALFAAFLLSLALQNANLVQRLQIEKILSSACIVGSFATLYLQLLQLIGADVSYFWVMPLPDGAQPHGNVAQRNQASYIHCLGILGLMAIWSKASFKPVYALILGLPVLGIALCGSRLGLILGAVAICCVDLLRNGSARAVLQLFAKRLAIYAVWYTISIVVMSAWSAGPHFENAIERMQSHGSLPREWLQTQAWNMWIQRPLLGQGWGSFSHHGLQMVEQASWPSYSNDSHFFISHIAAELGLLGLLCLLPAANAARKALKTRTTRLSGFCTALCGITLIYSCSEFPLWHAFFLLPFVACLSGATAGEYKSSEADTDTQSRHGLVVGGVVGAVLAALLYSSYAYFQVLDIGAEVFSGKPMSDDLRRRSSAATSYVGFSAITDLYVYVGLSYDENRLPEKIELGRRVAGQFNSSSILEKQAVFLALDDQPSQAAKYYRALCLVDRLSCASVMNKLNYLAVAHKDKFASVAQIVKARSAEHERSSREK